ncbi:uncharacterized protein LOC119088230 [Peromyscus leucopus]|uniref:uncharacterized protein LOC119088230 n=1 Tax=Peromyscus leucopus TaxID=10041 RepID=UPI001884B105|nr:uncharacterized protein LOC119088230 [Peromyscus leucopus]
MTTQNQSKWRKMKNNLGVRVYQGSGSPSRGRPELLSLDKPPVTKEEPEGTPDRWRGTGQAGAKLRGPGCQPGARLDREGSSRGLPNTAGSRRGWCGGEEASAALPGRPAPPSGHVTPASVRPLARSLARWRSALFLPSRRGALLLPVPSRRLPHSSPRAPITARARERPPLQPAPPAPIGCSLKDASRRRAATIGGPSQPSSRMREHSAV